MVKIIINTLVKNLEGKRAVMKKISLNLCELFEQKVTLSVFDYLENSEKSLVERLLQEKNSQNKKNTGNIKDFIK